MAHRIAPLVDSTTHLDHLGQSTLDWVLNRTVPAEGLAVETVETPFTGRCYLHKVPASDRRIFFRRRGDRENASRMVLLPSYETNDLTVVALDGRLLTAYWGQAAPPEPGAGEIPESAEGFWSEHALSPEPVVVTRHAALVEYLVAEGVVPADVRVISHATDADVSGRHVFGNVPLEMAVLAACVTTIPLALTAEDRGRDLGIERLQEIAGTPSTFQVSQV